MKIYTKTGDAGETGLLGGPRVSKNHVRIEAYGAVDELNAFLGLARAEPLPDEVASILARLQHELFRVGAALATPDAIRAQSFGVSAAHIERLEAEIDAAENRLAPLTQFILPDGTRAASLLHVARVVCRRAERRVISLCQTPETVVAGELVIYLNRLSDLLFVLARDCNRFSGVGETPWKKD